MRGVIFGVLLLVVIGGAAWFGSDGQIAAYITPNQTHGVQADDAQDDPTVAAQAVKTPFVPTQRVSANLHGDNSKMIWSCTEKGLALSISDNKLLASTAKPSPTEKVGITFGSGPGQGITVFGNIGPDNKTVQLKGAIVWKAAETIAGFHGPAVIKANGKHAGSKWILMNADRPQKQALLAFVENCKP